MLIVLTYVVKKNSVAYLVDGPVASLQTARDLLFAGINPAPVTAQLGDCCASLLPSDSSAPNRPTIATVVETFSATATLRLAGVAAQNLRFRERHVHYCP